MIDANGVSGLGDDLDAARKEIRRRSDPKYRARLREKLRKGTVMEKDGAIRELASLRCAQATPDLIGIAARGPRRLREVAVAHLWKLHDAKVAPTLVHALRSWETANVADYALRQLTGKRRDQAIALLEVAGMGKDDFAATARSVLERMNKKRK